MPHPAVTQHSAARVRAVLVDAFTHGRTRLAKPVVLPVVDRAGPPAAAGLVVEELELCSERDHPHGQGWVPLRIMYKPQAVQPCTARAPAAQVCTASNGTRPASSTSSTAPAVAAALSSMMQVTHTSMAAAAKVIAGPPPAAPAALLVAEDAGGRQTAAANSVPTSIEAGSLNAGAAGPAACAPADVGPAQAAMSCMHELHAREGDVVAAATALVAAPTADVAADAAAAAAVADGAGAPAAAVLAVESAEPAQAAAAAPAAADAADSAAAAVPDLLLMPATPTADPAVVQQLYQRLNDSPAPNNSTRPPIPQPVATATTAAAVMSSGVAQQQAGSSAVGVLAAKASVASNAAGIQGGQQQAAGPRRLPVVILLHSTGSDMGRMRSEQEACARAGYLAVAIDCRYHGARCVVQHEGQSKREVYLDALVRAWREGSERPFLLDNLWDLTHLLDYLTIRPDADPARIGVTGVSLGGMHAWLLAAADPRVAVAAPMIGVQGFAWALQQELWHERVNSIRKVFEVAAEDLGRPEVDSLVVRAVWDKLLPGLLDVYDSPMSLALIAPRPLLVANGELDPRCPLPGVVEAMRIAHAAYAQHHADNTAATEHVRAAAAITAAQQQLEPWTHPSMPDIAALSTAPTISRQLPTEALQVLQSTSTGQDGQVVQASSYAVVVTTEGTHTGVNSGADAGSPAGDPSAGVDGQPAAGMAESDGQLAAQAAASNGDSDVIAARAPQLSAASRAWASKHCVLYVEPGCAHEERPGKWAAVRAFLDLHLRGVGRSDAYMAALQKRMVALD